MLSEVDAIHGEHTSKKVLSKKTKAYEVLLSFYITWLLDGDLM